MPGNDNLTKVLLHFDGSDASTTITDSNAGGSAHTWTAAGNAQIDTAQSKFGGGSLLCDGSGDSVWMIDHADLTLGSSDFTIDWWSKRAANGDMRVFGQGNASGQNVSISAFSGFNSGNFPNFMVFSGANQYAVTSGTAITDTSWHHYAGVRSGNTLIFFVDGTSVGTTDLTGVTVNDSSNALHVGKLGEFAGFYFNGWVDEFRWSVGAARWTSNFTPPTEAYTLETVLTAETGVYTITGQNALFAANTLLGTGAYTLSGQSAGLGHSIPANAGAYALTGSAALFSGNFVLDAGSYLLTGIDSVLDRSIVMGPGSYLISGEDAHFITTLTAGTGGYSLSGQDATFSGAAKIETGEYLIAGHDCAFATIMQMDAGAYLLTGKDATLALLEEFRGNRAPLLIRKNGDRPASYWSGIPAR